MNDAEKLAAIDQIIHDADAAVSPWYRDTSTPEPTEALVDVSNITEIKRYTAHGFKTNLKRGVAAQDWDSMLAIADQIYTGQNVAGSENFDSDTAINLVLGGGTQGGGLGQPLRIYAPAGLTLVESAAWLVALPNSGAGPSGL